LSCFGKSDRGAEGCGWRGRENGVRSIFEDKNDQTPISRQCLCVNNGFLSRLAPEKASKVRKAAGGAGWKMVSDRFLRTKMIGRHFPAGFSTFSKSFQDFAPVFSRNCN
jgi:hypothetical protein